jgi:hypothetical protein
MRKTWHWRWAAVIAAIAGTATPTIALAQFEPPPREEPAPARPEDATQPETWGALDPGKGFELGRTRYGTLRFSNYTLVRYMNQLPAEQTFEDHLGRTREIDLRHDIQLHRMLLTFTGWIFDPKLEYASTVWTVNSTTQINVVGYLSYDFGRALTLYGGVGGLPGTRSLQGSHPFWLGNDRVMADEFFRPGFTMGVWATGEPVPALHYNVMLGNNLSTLGISAAEDTREFATAGSIWWTPAGEFGPRGGFGDYEHHQNVATRFGASFTRSRENRFSALSQAGPDNTQIRLSDSLNLFEADSLADGVTVEDATYQMLALDAGLKHAGFFLQAEYYTRWITDIEAAAPLPLDHMFDHGFYVQASYMIAPELLELYASTSHVFGHFNDSHEVVGGANLFPFDTRNARLNAQVIGVDRSPTSSVFGYYVGGQRGATLALAASVFF